MSSAPYFIRFYENVACYFPSGKPSRIAREKFGSLSAARARSLIKLRCLNSAKGSLPGSDGVMLIKHFVGFSVKENAPIPWCAELSRALGANACGAVACNGVVPTRTLVQNASDNAHAKYG
jgi:hypothetical protein